MQPRLINYASFLSLLKKLQKFCLLHDESIYFETFVLKTMCKNRYVKTDDVMNLYDVKLTPRSEQFINALFKKFHITFSFLAEKCVFFKIEILPCFSWFQFFFSMMKIGTLFAAFKKRKTYGKRSRYRNFLRRSQKLYRKSAILRKNQSALTLRSKYNQKTYSGVILQKNEEDQFGFPSRNNLGGIWFQRILPAVSIYQEANLKEMPMGSSGHPSIM